MHSEQDLSSLYDYLKATPEGPLKKMLTSPKMTEVHVRLLLKIVRGCSSSEFVQHAQAQSFPKVKLNAQEMAVKETLWPLAMETCKGLGLIGPEVKAA